ncbi:MAG: bifunctional glutamate N-acetyltransferase/amino-acid acetyltransferase ArgJ [Lentisphaeria bacterium]|nr:bifunctional glutamate N-acetyltransferase/amino-acid acetyltransferase ArgJ [Lentisphaeria bacterium]
MIESGGATSASGFEAAGVTCGLKRSGKADLALLYSRTGCNSAGTFTSNLFPAAPVVLCKERVAGPAGIRAVVVNSGVANACTGDLGMENARAVAKLAAEALGIDENEALSCSTGRIGVQLPMDKLAAGIRAAAAAKKPDGGHEAALAIMTTDTRPKECAVSFLLNGKKVTVGGMTKGAGMIAPHMYPAVPHATMLCFITTDAASDNDSLTRFLADAVDVSFNRITVDNDMSTNDTCLLLANGESGARVAYDGSEAAKLFADALRHVAQTLAKGMVMDGEGSSKFVEVVVTGAKDAAQAHICAKAIADSMLCKTAWFGCDPNWGRILAAAGYSGAQFRPEDVSLDYNDKPVVRGGMDAGTPEAELSELMKTGSFTVHIDLGAGVASDIMWTSDITYDYVKINADYHT